MSLVKSVILYPHPSRLRLLIKIFVRESLWDGDAKSLTTPITLTGSVQEAPLHAVRALWDLHPRGLGHD